MGAGNIITNYHLCGFNVYIFADLVKHGVLTLVGEIWRSRTRKRLTRKHSGHISVCHSVVPGEH